jgi:hypothetical protein
MSRYALLLNGYDSASLRGCDEPLETFFAQLWRDTSDSWNDPDFSVTGTIPIDNPIWLAKMISRRPGVTTEQVIWAMGAAKARDAPQVRASTSCTRVAVTSRRGFACRNRTGASAILVVAIAVIGDRLHLLQGHRQWPMATEIPPYISSPGRRPDPAEEIDSKN